MEFDVIPKPTASITAANEICLGDTITLNGVMTNKIGQNWSIISGKGKFINPTLETVKFIPKQTGKINIQLVATPATGCNAVATNHQFDVAEPVVLTVLPTSSICENAMAQISATASNYQSITWNKVTGNGTLNNSTTLTPIYTPATAILK